MLSAVIGAGACLLTGVLSCAAVAVVGWLAAGLGGATGAVRAGAVVWLLAHKSGVTLGGEVITLAPLGLTIAIVAGLYRAGRFTARASSADRTPELVTAAATLTATYGAGAALVAVLASSSGASVPPLSALLGAGLLAALAGTAGVLVESGAGADVADALPDWFRDALPGALAAAGATVAAGTALYAVSLIAHWGRVGDLVTGLDPGPVGGAVLFALCLVLLPNAALFAVAFLAGPGFQLGTGTTVAPTGVELGNLPAFPLLAALPSNGATPSYLLVLTAAVPLLAGAAGGVVVARRAAGAPAGDPGWEGYAGRAAMAGSAGRPRPAGPDEPGRRIGRTRPDGGRRRTVGALRGRCAHRGPGARRRRGRAAGPASVIAGRSIGFSRAERPTCPRSRAGVRVGVQPAGPARRLRRPGVRRVGGRRRCRPGRDRRVSTGPSRGGVPTFVDRVKDHDERDDWDRRADRARRRPQARPGRLGRLPQARRRAVPGAGSATGTSTPTTRCCRRSPASTARATRSPTA